MAAGCDVLYMDRRLAKNLRRIREERHLTQEQLGEMAEVKQGTLSGMESGRRGWTRRTVLRLVAVLKLDIEELFLSDETREKLQRCKVYDDLTDEDRQTLADMATVLHQRRGQRFRSSA